MRESVPIKKAEGIETKELDGFIRNYFNLSNKEELILKQFGAGSSNLTYSLQVGDWEGVLRRAPIGPVNKKAHDMKREFNILKEINPVFSLAPKPYVFCDDSSVIGAPFYIMEKRNGILLEYVFQENIPQDEKLYNDISYKLVETLVQLHDIDYEQTGLRKMTRPDGFLKRQVIGWIERYKNVKLEDSPDIIKLEKFLLDYLPTTEKSTIIHYDYHLNNILFDKNEPSRITSLLDWEMSTVGDPLTDLASAMVYWIEDNDSEDYKAIKDNPITTRPGFYTRHEFIEAYSKLSKRDLSNMDYYMCFAYFKNMVIAQQIYYRWKLGYAKDERFANLDGNVRVFFELAMSYIS